MSATGHTDALVPEVPEKNGTAAGTGALVSAKRTLKRWMSARSRRPDKCSKQSTEDAAGQQTKTTAFLKSARRSLKRWMLSLIHI